MSTRARSPEVDEFSCVPETQQAAGVEEMVVGLEDPLEILDTQQGDIGLETQHELDTSDEDTQDHKLLQLLHRRARAQARATKGARNPQF